MKKLLALTLVVALLVSIPLVGTMGASKTKLSVWTFWKQSWVQPALDKFMAAHPDVEIEYQQLSWSNGFDKIVTAIAAGKAPDVMELGSTWMAQFIENKTIAPIDITAIKDEYSGWNGATGPDGNVYGYPWFGATNILYINADLAKQAGIDKCPATWSELKADSEAIDALSPGVRGFSIKIGGRYTTWQKFMPFAWSDGARVVSADWKEALVPFDRFVEALEYYNSLKKSSLVGTQDEVRQAFYLGRVGIIMDGPGLNLKKNAPKLNYFVCLLPKPDRPDTKSVGFSGADYIVVTSQSKQKTLATELAQDISQGNLISNHIKTLLPFYKPDLTALMSKYPDDPELKVYVEQMKNATSPAPHPRWVDLQEILTGAIESTILGRGSAEDNLAKAKKEMDSILAEYLKEQGK